MAREVGFTHMAQGVVLEVRVEWHLTRVKNHWALKFHRLCRRLYLRERAVLVPSFLGAQTGCIQPITLPNIPQPQMMPLPLSLPKVFVPVLDTLLREKVILTRI